ncbi:restriction endonuclease subunit S [Pseudenterobacter timonensis]|uniref:restriction endonuclease subunit S n=1 Tax=Pseudenterobacter timonensis TaxID=1755099 RepID=UPI00077B6D3A|nr:restriction endonuclease subunit S [Pseudenterobacter timonensis]
MVPEGWKLSTIEEVSNVSSGGTPSRKNDTYWNGNIPWVTTAEVQFKVIEDTSEKITEEGLANSSAKLFPVNTILMAMYGQGKTRGQVAKLGIEASTNQACAAIVLHPGYEVDYYYQFLISQYENIREMANSGGQENLSGGIVKSIQVPVPPYPEQKKIAQILSTWDKAITTTEKLLANSQQQKKALMQQLLTGKKRLLDKNGARYPEWKFHKVGKFFTPYKELVSADTNLPILTSSRTGLFEQERSVINEGSYGVLPKGYFTYRHMSDDLIFKFNLNRSWERGAISKEYPVFKTDGLDSVFLEAQLNYGPAFKKFAVQQKQGGTRTRLYYKNLCDFGFKMPSLEEQRKIAAVLSTADQEITALQQKLDALKQEKKALMQQLLTGKRRVKVDNKEVA